MFALLLLTTINLHVTTGGKPTVARVYITDASGKAYRIPGMTGYDKRGEIHSIVDQSAEIPLPPGKYMVRAEKGLEYLTDEKTVEVGEEQVHVELDVPRFYDMNAKGWYSADLHIHRDPAEMPFLVRAEDLNIAPTITRHVGGPKPFTQPYPVTSLMPVDGTHIVSLQNQEVERLYGAVALLNTPEPVEAKLHDLFPLEIEFCRRAHRQGGFVDGEKPIWKSVPIIVALGGIDAIGVVNNHFHPNGILLDAEKYGSMERERPGYNTVAGFAQWIIDLYYSFLNCGFRLPVSAGSASGVMPSWIGYERVYVRMSSAFSYEQWFRDLKAGRSIATNGPLLDVAVDGKPPGAAFKWKRPTRAKIGIEVHSREPLERLEVVFNGNVVSTLPAKSVLKSTVVVPIAEPGWLAVRCFGPAGRTIRYAHSSPFYFVKDGKLPVHKADALRWADFIHKLASSAGPADYPSPSDYAHAQATYRDAEEVYRSLAR